MSPILIVPIISPALGPAVSYQRHPADMEMQNYVRTWKHVQVLIYASRHYLRPGRAISGLHHRFGEGDIASPQILIIQLDGPGTIQITGGP